MDDIKQQVYQQYVESINPGLARLLRFSRFDVVEFSGEGSIIKDTQGKEYIDCVGGYGVFTLGHRHPEIVEAVKTQLDIMPMSSKLFLNKPMADLASLLSQITPGDLKYSFFVNSGAEAVENAIKLARLATGREQIIAAVDAFHGKTFGALSASGREVFKKPFAPLVPAFTHAPFGDVAALSDLITDKTAAVILEPIQGEGGIIIPPPSYLRDVRELCDKKDVLLIIDEIQTGLGRTGKLFAVDYDGVVPDIMTLAKALGGGVMPIGAVIGREKVWEQFKKDPLIITSTFGGNPLACSAAIASIKIITREKIWEKAAASGALLMNLLSEIAKKHPRIIKDIRGKGLLIGVELHREGLGGVIIPEMVKNGVIVGYTLNQPKVIRFEPPLIIDESLIKQAVEVFSKAVDEAEGLFDKMFG